MIIVGQEQPSSLYQALGEPTPPLSIRGETLTTKDAKETIDRDVEMLIIEELFDAA